MEIPVGSESHRAMLTRTDLKDRDKKLLKLDKLDSLTMKEKIDAGSNFFRRNADKIKFYQVRTVKGDGEKEENKVRTVKTFQNLK